MEMEAFSCSLLDCVHVYGICKNEVTVNRRMMACLGEWNGMDGISWQGGWKGERGARLHLLTERQKPNSDTVLPLLPLLPLLTCWGLGVKLELFVAFCPC
eukprot:scaffold4597_cov177-Ochromonas_danica.AAC.3